MTLPTSGAMSLGAGGNITTEFGLAADAPFPSAYYGKGGAPSSGPLSTADFYGRSNTKFTPDGGEVVGAPSATLLCTTPATWTYTPAGGSGGSVDLPSGATATSITFLCNDTINGQGRQAFWNVTGVSGSVTRNFHLTVSSPSWGG